MSRPLRIGTRRSRLALWQANWVAARLRERDPSLAIELTGIVSEGDRVLGRPLPEIGGKGLFTQELDRALVAGAVDLAVHSLKDLPTALTEGLALVAVPPRADARDVFVGRGGAQIADLPQGAAVGTSSLRRRALLLHRRPDLRVVDLRGNVETRLSRVAEGDLAGCLLALAGLDRLGCLPETAEALDPAVWVPMVGQGALGIVARADREDVRALAAALEDAPTRAAVTAERALLARLEGGCHVPIGAHARLEGGALVLDCLIAAPDGARLVRARRTGSADDAAAVGVAAAEELLARGGEAIMADLRKAAGTRR